MVNEYSCVCLHGDRRPQERKDNLMAFKVTKNFKTKNLIKFKNFFLLKICCFKTGEVRFLICTDVAARGIDIRGIPFG